MLFRQESSLDWEKGILWRQWLFDMWRGRSDSSGDLLASFVMFLSLSLIFIIFSSNLFNQPHLKQGNLTLNRIISESGMWNCKGSEENKGKEGPRENNI